MSEQFCEAFIRIAELANVSGVAPIGKLPGCWEFDLGKNPSIRFAVNGHDCKVRCSMGAEVDPFTAYATWNGFPFAILSPVDANFLQSPSRKPGSSERLVAMRLAKAIRETRA